ncbi:MAG: 3-dehydroquinate synthase [Bacteroidales bacterium]|nr:3-dehydroquinate synthase [Bacteroidales bacterium]
MTTKLILPGRISPLSLLGRLLKGPAYDGAHYCLVVDENSYAHCLPQVVSRVAAFEEAEFVEVPVGEDCKSIEVATHVWQTLLESKADSNTVIVCLGGGAVCDLGGFVAATYRRGLRHINIPTTLVAMADAAIGGKTALNLDGVKNQVGVVRMPEVVCIDPSFLDTLPPAELLSGVFEVVKTAAVADADLFLKMVAGTVPPASAQAISQVAAIKQAVVKADPNDHGIRHILNFGHTFGHAIEAHSSATGVALPHGIAVGIGMLMAMRLSVLKTGLPRESYDTYRRFVLQYVETPHFTLIDAEQMLAYIKTDKKNHDGLVLAVLMRNLGEPIIDIPLSDNEIRDTLLSGGLLA